MKNKLALLFIQKRRAHLFSTFFLLAKIYIYIGTRMCINFL